MPSPAEFVAYIFDKVSTMGRTEIDPHFRPQWVMCPFCYMDLDIVAKIEDYDRDSNYILKSLNLLVGAMLFTSQFKKICNQVIIESIC